VVQAELAQRPGQSKVGLLLEPQAVQAVGRQIEPSMQEQQ